MSFKKIDIDEYPFIVWMYETGSTLKEICTLFEVSRESIAKILRKNSVIIQNGNTRIAERGVKADFFEQDNEQAAYFYGFLLADGNIADSGKVSICLQSDDSHILESFKSELNLSSAVRHNVRKTGERYSQLCFTNKRIAESLNNLGMFPRKSLSEKAPEKYLNNKHFWRGVIDGDGSISDVPKSTARFYLCGSKEMCKQFLEYCKTIEPSLKCNVNLSAGELYRVTFSGVKASKLLQELYSDCQFSLLRKQDRANKIIGKYNCV